MRIEFEPVPRLSLHLQPLSFASVTHLLGRLGRCARSEGSRAVVVFARYAPAVRLSAGISNRTRVGTVQGREAEVHDLCPVASRNGVSCCC